MHPLLSIILINYNSRDYIIDCIKSIPNAIGPHPYEIIVIDNHSTDDSCHLIEKTFPNVILIRNDENSFIAKAFNQGIQASKGKYVLFLNPDIILSEGSFYKMLQFMEDSKNLNVGGVLPRLATQEGHIEACAFRDRSYACFILNFTFLGKLFPHLTQRINHFEEYQDWDRKTDRTVHNLVGSCYLIRRFIFEKTGLYDEHFKLYFLESDLCIRVRKLGFINYFLSSIEVIHHRHKSVSKESQNKISNIWRQDALYFCYKHYGLMKGLLLKFLMLVTQYVSFIKKALSPVRNPKNLPIACYGHCPKIASQ